MIGGAIQKTAGLIFAEGCAVGGQGRHHARVAVEAAEIGEVGGSGGRADQARSVEFVHACKMLLLADDSQAVGDAEHHGLDAGVLRDEVVELAKRLGVRVGRGLVDDPAVPQDVVD